MSDKISLAFCVHSHQPVGNYEKVFAQGAQDCYLPFLRMLKEYPNIGATLHYTGALLEWLDANAGEFGEMIKHLVASGQAEMMGGGFYEPILAVIPEADVRHQIEAASKYNKDKFGVETRGMWCAERIWDPCLPKKVSGLAMEYTLLDDTHFLAAGLSPEDINGYYITEREGCKLNVFPIDMHLRYLIPFRQPEETVEYLLRLRDKGVNLVTYGDDGEKFGMWPGTKKWVYEETWLKRFLDAISACPEIEVVTLCSALDAHEARGRVYLPTASYQEMMEWSLFCAQGRYYEEIIAEEKKNNCWEKKRAFLRGGLWDNFLAKYPESNLMHKKMLKISSLVNTIDSDSEALRHLLMAQCNCSYWHGLFGGIYLGMLRHAVYENLLDAEKIIDATRLKDKDYIIEQADYDIDGHDEILISGRNFNCYFSPENNASAMLMEYKPYSHNLSNVMMKHEEIYHNQVRVADENEGREAHDGIASIHDINKTVSRDMMKLLNYDTYPRYSFFTHIFKSAPELENILDGIRPQYNPALSGRFSLIEKKENQEGCSLIFSSDKFGKALTKEYSYDFNGALSLTHRISLKEECWLAVEWNLMLFGEEFFVDGDEAGLQRGIFSGKRLEFRDYKNMKIIIESPKNWDMAVAPIECLSQSEAGFDKTFQGWNVFFIRKVTGHIPEVTLRVE